MRKMPFRVFPPEVVAKIRAMKLAGAKSREIAKAIGTTVNSLDARCCQLGIRRPKRTDIAA